jgi:hypothetical protein
MLGGGRRNLPRAAIVAVFLAATSALAALAAGAGGGSDAGRIAAASRADPAQAVETAQRAPRRRQVRRIGSRTGTGTLVGRARTVRKARATLRRPPVAGYTGRGQGRPAEPPEPPEAPFTPTVPPTTEGPAPARANTTGGQVPHAAGDFTVFRNTVTSTSAADSVEPTAANDRNGIIATGNFFAAVSDDNGLTFGPLDPTAGQLHGGFCCDQVAYAVDRGSYSLVFWLMQDWPSTSSDQNALRLWLFRGRGELLAPQDQSEVCDWSFEPQEDPGFDLGRNRWFDFNQISHTNDFLYITTNVRDSSGNSPANDWSDGPRVGGMIFRISLDDIDDGNCAINYRFWYRDGDPYISPVQNAGSTMYLATHVPGGLEGDNLRIYSIADSSTTLEKKDKDIENFKDVDGNCPLPGGRDPCGDQHSGRMSGFRSGSTIGWLWMADEENDFPFPHVRVAAFATGSLDKVVEHQIWSDEFAWQLPSVGVNEDGELGVILYAMGGGRFPKAQGFIRTDPRNWSGIQMNALASSDSAPPDGDGDGRVSFGHYGSVRPYGNCPETFLGSAYTIDGGTPTGRFIWFGKEGDGCVDLVATKVTKSGAGPFRSGETMTVTTTIQNQGSALAPASFVGYYLSRDEVLSDDDISFGTTRAANALDPVEQHELEASLIVPGVGLFPGEFFLIACADDVEQIAELTDTNNCAVTSRSFTVEPNVQKVPAERDFSLSQVSQQQATPVQQAGSAFTISETVRSTTAQPVLASARVSYSLSSTPVADDDRIPLAGRVVGTPRRAGARLVTSRRLTLPRRVPPGRWYLIGCLRHPRARVDARAANDCRAAPRALTVGGSPATPGPARPRGGRQ